MFISNLIQVPFVNRYKKRKLEIYPYLLNTIIKEIQIPVKNVFSSIIWYYANVISCSNFIYTICLLISRHDYNFVKNYFSYLNCINNLP